MDQVELDTACATSVRHPWIRRLMCDRFATEPATRNARAAIGEAGLHGSDDPVGVQSGIDWRGMSPTLFGLIPAHPGSRTRTDASEKGAARIRTAFCCRKGGYLAR